MKKDRNSREKNDKTLRQRATEQMVEAMKGKKEAAGDGMSPAEIQRLVQELQIHQIELETQNKDLQQARDEAEAERLRYHLAGARLLNLERSRLPGRHLRYFIFSADLREFDVFLNKVFTARDKVHCLVALGKERNQLIHIQIDAMLTEDGQLCRAAVMDVTERKNAEDNLRKLQDELEKRVADRTSQLAESLRDLESFSYSVSHDLQGPLRAIEGFARMILRDNDRFDAETLRKFAVILENTRKMGQLIEHLLNFSRLGRKHLSVAEIDMNAVVNEAWENLKIIHCNRPMVFTCSDLPPAMGDAELIGQVVNNILLNAVKFAKPEGGISVEVGAYQDENETVYFIKDNGIGFDMAYYNKLFGLFQRLHNPDEFEGTGVGLAIVQRIVARHGGRVWAEAKVNEGATFYFGLPLKHAK